MLSAAIKEHSAEQAAQRKETDKLRGAAVGAARRIANVLVDKLNQEVVEVFATQKQLEQEVKHLQSNLGRYTKTSGQWVSMVDNFNQALKEIGDVENWAERIEADMRVVVETLSFVHKQEQPASPTPDAEALTETAE